MCSLTLNIFIVIMFGGHKELFKETRDLYTGKMTKDRPEWVLVSLFMLHFVYLST